MKNYSKVKEYFRTWKNIWNTFQMEMKSYCNLKEYLE